MKIFVVLMLTMLYGSISLFGQQRAAYGAFVDGGVNIHTADFRSLPGVPSCCPQYGSGMGGGYSMGILYQHPLGSEELRVALRGVLSSYGGSLVREESVTLSGNVGGVFEHSVQATLLGVGIEPVIQYNVWKALWLSSGAQVGWVLQKDFSQKERITQPSNGTFEDGSRARNVVQNAVIPNAQNLTAGLVIGASYDLPLNTAASMILAPELMFSLPLNGIVQDVSWSVSQLRGGVALKWSPAAKQEPVRRLEEKEDVDTLKIPAAIAQAEYKRGVEYRQQSTQESEEEILTSITIRRSDTLFLPELPKQRTLTAKLRAMGIEKDGSEVPVVRMTVEEFSSARVTTPLLNYVFFDENSSELSSRYQQLSPDLLEQFDEERLSVDKRLEIYHTLLNIIGKRLKNEPQANITLMGCNDGTSQEKNNIQLSRQRAENLKSYLVNTWGIAEQRIKVEATNLPAKAASGGSTTAMEENRRVEISSNISDILAPIVLKDTLRIVNPPTLRFYTTLQNDTTITSWQLAVTQSGRLLKTFSAQGALPAVLEWHVDAEGDSKPLSNDKIECTLALRDAANTTTTAFTSISVEQVTLRQKMLRQVTDTGIDKYSIVLFDIRSAEINAETKRFLAMIKSRIEPTSKVSITGYSDRLGDAKTNQALAWERALATASALGLSKDAVSIQGIGNTELYDANLPEGRLYSRTVDIVVETPIHDKKQP